MARGLYHWEHGRSLAAAQLQGSRGRKHENDCISVVLGSLAMNFWSGMCKYIRDSLVKGIIITFNGSTRNVVAVGSSAAGGKDSDTYHGKIFAQN